MTTDAARIDRLLPELRRRSPDAFHDLYDLMAPQLVAFLHACSGSRTDAEDATQEVFLALTRSIRRFRGDGTALLAWLYRTARNRCADHHRRASRRREKLVDRFDDARQTTATPPAGAGIDEVDPDLRAALLTLTDDQRTAVLLRRVAGLDGNAVGAVMGRDREAVYALVARAESALRARLTGSALDPATRPRLEG